MLHTFERNIVYTHIYIYLYYNQSLLNVVLLDVGFYPSLLVVFCAQACRFAGQVGTQAEACRVMPGPWIGAKDNPNFLGDRAWGAGDLFECQVGCEPGRPAQGLVGGDHRGREATWTLGVGHSHSSGGRAPALIKSPKVKDQRRDASSLCTLAVRRLDPARRWTRRTPLPSTLTSCACWR